MVNITFVRETYVAGTKYAAAATLDASEDLARDLVWRGDANFTTPQANTPQTRSDIRIPVAQISDSGATGRNIVKASNLAAFLTSIGATLGANDSGGSGKKALVFPNATT